MIIDLSNSMQQRVREWQRMRHQLDVTLLYQCAYYPRGGCQDCSWELPNPDCRWAHILTDTQINPPDFHQIKTKRKGKKTVKLEVLLSHLPKEVREEIMRIAEGR